jgi:hypothetical protein
MSVAQRSSERPREPWTSPLLSGSEPLGVALNRTGSALRVRAQDVLRDIPGQECGRLLERSAVGVGSVCQVYGDVSWVRTVRLGLHGHLPPGLCDDPVYSEEEAPTRLVGASNSSAYAVLTSS